MLVFHIFFPYQKHLEDDDTCTVPEEGNDEVAVAPGYWSWSSAGPSPTLRFQDVQEQPQSSRYQYVCILVSSHPRHARILQLNSWEAAFYSSASKPLWSILSTHICYHHPKTDNSHV